jgi:hypothetical protein
MINKQGDLAFINTALRPANMGAVVTCTQYLGYYLQGDYVEMHGEYFKAYCSDNFWLISGDLLTQFGPAKESYIPDLWLTPILADKLDTEENEHLTIDDKISA